MAKHSLGCTAGSSLDKIFVSGLMSAHIDGYRILNEELFLVSDNLKSLDRLNLNDNI